MHARTRTQAPKSLTLFALSAALLAGGCSLIAGGTSKLGSSSPVKGGSAPELAADEDDPPHVRAALDQLDSMEKLITARDYQTYARESSRFQRTFLFQNGWADEPKHDAMYARLSALDAQAIASFGGRVAGAAGDAARLTKGVDEDAIEAAGEMLKACSNAAGLQASRSGDGADKLATALAAYEKAIARVTKLDPKAFRFIGDNDVAMEMLACEHELVGTASEVGDEYQPEVHPKTETERGCGVMEWMADGVQIGSGRFAPYSRTVGGSDGAATPIACNKIPKRSKAGKQFAAAIREFADRESQRVADLIVVTKGAPEIQADDDDLRLHRYQVLVAYSKKFEFSKNPCGPGKTFCEAGGSRGAEAYNRMEHHLARAAVHAGRDADRCKQHLKQAIDRATWFAQFRADAIKSKQWETGATYKTKLGAKLPEPEFVASFAAQGERADAMLLDKFCTRAAAPAKAGKATRAAKK